MDAETNPSKTLGHWLPGWLSWPLAGVALLLVVVTGWRIAREYSTQQREFDWENRALSDFHNGIYYPTLAFRNGISPYSQAAVEQFELTRPSPPYSPFLFVLHLPLTWLPVFWADIVFSIVNLGMLAALAAMGVRYSTSRFDWPVFWLVLNMLLVSRPGHITLFTGYFTLEFILGTILALQYSRSRPWVAAIGLLLASGKPTYFLPLLLLMAARRDGQALWRGMALSMAGAAIGVAWLALHEDPMSLVREYRETQAVHHADETEFPVNSWTRVDVLGMVAKVRDWVPDDRVYLGAMVLLLAIPMFVIWRLRPVESNTGATGLTAWLAVLSLLLSIYHHSYDCLLLVVPWVGILFYGPLTLAEIRPWVRWAVALLAAIPAGNYLSTISFRNVMGWDSGDSVWQAVTMLNAICLVIALALLLGSGIAMIRKGGRKGDDPD